MHEKSGTRVPCAFRFFPASFCDYFLPNNAEGGIRTLRVSFAIINLLIPLTRSFIGKSKQDNAWLVQHAQGKNVAEIEIERQDNAGIDPCTPHEFGVGSPFQTQRTNVYGVMTEVLQKINGLRRNTGIRQESHQSRAKRMKLVLSESSSVGKRLSNVFFVEIRQILDDLGHRHTVGNQINDMRHGDTKTADRGPSAKYVRLVRNAIEHVFHDLPRTDDSTPADNKKHWKAQPRQQFSF